MPVSFPTLSLAGAPTDGTNEVQRLTTGGTWSSGTFTVTYDGQTTAALDFDATAAEVAAAMNALSNLGVGEVEGSGGPFPATPIDLTFVGPISGGLEVNQVTADATNIVGAGHTITPSTVTAGVRGSYRGVQGGAVLMDTTNARVYSNGGNAQTPAWVEYTP